MLAKEKACSYIISSYRPLTSNLFSQPVFKILVAKMFQQFDFAIGVSQVDVRQGHAVKSIVFAHGVEGHVGKSQPVADF